MMYRPDLDNSPPSPASNPSRMKKPVHKTAITMNQNGTRLFIVTSIPDRRYGQVHVGLGARGRELFARVPPHQEQVHGAERAIQQDESH
jgi:hypothetical protein